MPTFAQIDESGRVVAVSMLSGKVDAKNMVPVEGIVPQLGTLWDGQAFLPDDRPAADVVTRVAFRQMFIMAEKVAFESFMATELTDEQRAALAAITKDFELTGEIDLADLEVASGL